MASGTQNLTSYKARYLAGGIAEVQQHLNITGTAYFSTGTSETEGKSILAYNGSNLNFGIRYFKSTPDVLTISASGNNNSKTDADFSINGLGNGILSHLGNYIPHTGNTTGTVGDDSRPVYVNAGTITQVNTPNSGAWFTGVPQVRSDGVMEIGKYIDWHHEDTTTKDYSIRMTAGDGTLTISGTTYGTFNGSLTGNATTASALAAYASIGSSTTDHGVALKNWFTANKSTAPRNQVISFYSATSGNGSQYMGYFLSGYADNPYGGFFVCHYNNPYYVGISNGTYTQQHILTSTNYTSYTVTKTGSGASGTWGISISGNAASASKVGAAATWLYFNNSNEVNFGGTNTSTTIFYGYRATDSRGKPTIHVFGSGEGTATVKAAKFQTGGNTAAIYQADRCNVTATNGTIGIHSATNRGLYEFTDNKWIIYLQHSDDTVHSGYKIYNAVWNDFAEMREGDITEGGYAVYDDGHGHMKLCTERLQPGARLTSDTFGIAVGHTEMAKTPIGVAGRVLVYPAQDRINYKVGDAVCAAPGGKVDLMTREEIMMYPERILGTVSEIPDYEIWNQRYKAEEEKEYTETNIEVKGRIWVYVR